MSASTTITTADNNVAGATPAAYPFSRLLYWSVLREVWENRSVYIAPLVAAGLLILAVVITVVEVLIHAEPIVGGNINVQGEGSITGTLWIPYMLIAAPVLGISVLVSFAYCLGALQGERRDRSILFWKSLPVSDLTTVLSKASIPLLVVPLIALVVAIITQLVIFVIALTVLPLFADKAHLTWAGAPITHQTLNMMWTSVPFGTLSLDMLYGVLVTALWQAPVYAWLLLVGGWAKRMAFVWAVAPVAGLMLAERIILGTTQLVTIVAGRFDDCLWLAFNLVDAADGKLPQATPMHVVADPGLWIGLVVAALFLGAAVLLRRYRQPI